MKALVILAAYSGNYLPERMKRGKHRCAVGESGVLDPVTFVGVP